MKFESDWAKTAVCIVPAKFYTQCQNWPWSLIPWPQINRVPPLIILNLHVKFKRDWTITAVFIVSTKLCKQSAKVDLDIWPHDPKSIGFLISLSTTCMWSLKVIGQKLQPVSCPQSFIHRVPKVTLTFDPKSILDVKFERDWTKTAVCIVPTRFYTKSVKVDLGLWSCDQR